jgi:nitroreductase
MPEQVSLYEGLVTTRAIRRFTSEPVSEEDLRAILFAATRAPSGSNRQPFRFLVLRDGPAARQARALLGGAARRAWGGKQDSDGYQEGSGSLADSPKARLARTMRRFVETFEQTPVVILGCLKRYRQPVVTEGGSIYPACQNLLLAARARGLGGVMSQWQSLVEPELREVLAIPDGVALHATISLGHPEGHHGPVRRRPLREFVYEDRWDEPAAWATDDEGASFTAAGPPGTWTSTKPATR